MPQSKSASGAARPIRISASTRLEFTVLRLIQLAQRKILPTIALFSLLLHCTYINAVTVRRGSNSFSFPADDSFLYKENDRSSSPPSPTTAAPHNSKLLDQQFKDLVNLTSNAKRPEIITAKSLRPLEKTGTSSKPTAVSNSTGLSTGNTTQSPAASTQRIMQLIQTASEGGNLRLHEGVGSALTKSLRLTSPVLRKAVAKTLRDVALQAGKPLDRIRILRAAMMLAGGEGGDKKKTLGATEHHNTTTISTLSAKKRELRNYGGGGCCGSQIVHSVPLCNQNNNDLAELALLMQGNSQSGGTTTTPSTSNPLLPVLAAIIGALLAALLASG